jgi:hypothetical protein
MITVSMGKNEGVQILKMVPHLPGIGKEKIRQPGIEEDFCPGCFQEIRKTGFATVIVIPDGVVIDKNGEGKTGSHRSVSPIQADETSPAQKIRISGVLFIYINICLVHKALNAPVIAF